MIKRFTLGAQKFKVHALSHDSNNLGRCYTALGRIEVQTVFDGKPIPEDSQEATLYHEVVHAMLDVIGRTDLNEDETFVQSLSAVMHQFDRTKK